MPRSHRRRVKDRRQEAEQRRVALEALTALKQRSAESRSRYVRAVFKPHAGEVVQTGDGRLIEIEGDGSLRPMRQGGKS